MSAKRINMNMTGVSQQRSQPSGDSARIQIKEIQFSMARNEDLVPASQGTEVTLVTEYISYRYFTCIVSAMTLRGTSTTTPCYGRRTTETKLALST